MSEKVNLTKADTVALRHAVQWMALCLKQNEQFPSDTLETERERLTAAKRALRKVNAIRKAGAPTAAKRAAMRSDYQTDAFAYRLAPTHPEGQPK